MNKPYFKVAPDTKGPKDTQEAAEQRASRTPQVIRHCFAGKTEVRCLAWINPPTLSTNCHITVTLGSFNNCFIEMKF